MYLEMVNDFEAKGGLDALTSIAKKTKIVEVMDSCIGILTAPYRLYHRLYVIEKLANFVGIAMKYMSNIPKEEFRFITKKGVLEELLGWIEDLMRRVYTSKTKGELLIKLRIDLSINLLGAEQLERRIQAIRLIAETCKAAKSSQEYFAQDTLPTANDSAILSSLLQVPQLIEEIFGKRSHIELIQRSTEILKFILLYSKITQEDFNVIWDCCTQDEQSKVEIFKVIADSCHLLPKELLGFIIDKLVALRKDEIKAQDVKILCELLSNYSKLTPEMLKQVLDLMWFIIKAEDISLPADIVEKVMTKFCDAITTPARVSAEITKEYFEQCYKMLEERKQSLFVLRVLRRSMVQLPNIMQFTSRNEMLFDFLTEGKVFINFFKDFELYYSNAKSKPINEQQHKEELLERKGFVIFLVKYANYKLTGTDLKFLWENLVQYPVLLDDQNSFYQIMWEVFCIDIENCVESLGDLTKFFESTICNEANNYQQLTIEGMSVINSLIFLVNKYMEKIMEVGSGRKKRYDGRFDHTYMLGSLNQGYNVEDFKSEIMDFRVKTLPTQIIGCSVLWKIALEAKSESVTMMAIEMINKIHTKISEELDNRIGEISSEFVEIAIEKLRVCYQQVVQDKQSRSNEIVKLLRLIEGMLDNSERKGNSGITPFISIKRGYNLTVKVQTFNMDPIVDVTLPDQFDLIVHSKITSCQLTILIAKRLNLAHEILRLIYMTCEVKDSDNGRILEELKVPDGEVIKVTKRTEEFIPRVNLHKNKALTDKARSVFTEVYERFSKEGKMFPSNYAEFTQVCLGDKSISENDYQIIVIYKDYDKEKKGHLLLEEFLKFYEVASISREEVVWNNLKELGYGPDLNKLDAEKPVVITNALPKDKLPRYLLANDSNYFDFLFSLVSKVEM
jgi:hypothetical protein